MSIVGARMHRTVRHHATALRAALWTVLSIRRARRVLSEHGLQASIPPPPPLPDSARRGMYFVLRRARPTCLERVSVVQAWLAAHDRPMDIVVGVGRRQGAVVAHAWLDTGAEAPDAGGYREIRRIAPPVVGP